MILPLGENEAVQVLQAAKQLNSKLDFSVSLGTFGKDDIKQFGSFAEADVLQRRAASGHRQRQDVADPADGHLRPLEVG